MLKQEIVKFWDTCVNLCQFSKEKEVRVCKKVILAIEKELKSNSIFDKIILEEEPRKNWCELVDKCMKSAGDWSQPQAFLMDNNVIFIYIDSISMGRQGMTFNSLCWRYK